ncbi:zinc ribbon domain-containing protein [Sphaerisporangium sp. NPDC005288]|uniref:zinc ribbon domain-containing protein n=1 Tax=Sphaerisporangium sp. NPDC005288 TaxID=3155114 RepID=UPI0033A9DACF
MTPAPAARRRRCTPRAAPSARTALRRWYGALTGCRCSGPEPLVSLTDWERLQAALEGNSNKRAGNRRCGSPLLRIVFCAVCDRAMYRNPGRNGAFSYRCASRAETSVSCGNGSIKAADLEAHVEDALLGEIGHLERVVKVHVPGEDPLRRVDASRKGYG